MCIGILKGRITLHGARRNGRMKLSTATPMVTLTLEKVSRSIVIRRILITLMFTRLLSLVPLVYLLRT